MPHATLIYRWLVLAAVLPAPAAYAQTLQFTGLGAPPRTLTASEIAQLPHQTQIAKDKEGKQHRYTGVPLPELLKLLGAPQGKAIHGPALTQVLYVTAADNYHTVFALPELDPAFTNQVVLLADQRDGQPLPRENGPYQLIVPQEKRPTRWVRQVTALQIVAVKP